MKSKRLTSILGSSLIACALTIGSLASTQSASAQSATALAEANIPFSFQMGTQTLPAGNYRIDRESVHLLLLRGPNQAAGFVTMNTAIASNAPKHGSMVFDHYGDKYYLRQIWTEGTTSGFECPKSRAEKQSVLATGKQAPNSVEVALNSAPKR